MQMKEWMVVQIDGVERKVSRTFWRGDNTQFRPSVNAMGKSDALIRHVLQGLMPSEPFIGKDTTIVTFGSCLAQHISSYLNTIDFGVASRKGKAFVSTMGDGIVNTFAIRQQFEWAWEGRMPKSLWAGYRAEEFGYDNKTRTATKELFDKATVFVITLGLSEVWYDELTGEVFWRAVPAEQIDPQRHKFRLTTQPENKANLNAIRDLIRKHQPKANIVFTMSPLPLAASFRPLGSLPADSASKATLRSAIDEMMSEHTDDARLHYFPSYEIVKDCFHYPYLNDFRHPHPHLLDLSMLAFERYFCMTNRTDAEVEAAYLTAIARDRQIAAENGTGPYAGGAISPVEEFNQAIQKRGRAPSVERETAIEQRDARIAERNARIAAREQRIRMREERNARIAAREDA